MTVSLWKHPTALEDFAFPITVRQWERVQVVSSLTQRQPYGGPHLESQAQEANKGGQPRQHSKFQASSDYRVRPCLDKPR